jgi:hypothetical protein
MFNSRPVTYLAGDVPVIGPVFCLGDIIVAFFANQGAGVIDI